MIESLRIENLAVLAGGMSYDDWEQNDIAIDAAISGQRDGHLLPRSFAYKIRRDCRRVAEWLVERAGEANGSDRTPVGVACAAAQQVDACP